MTWTVLVACNEALVVMVCFSPALYSTQIYPWDFEMTCKEAAGKILSYNLACGCGPSGWPEMLQCSGRQFWV
jgi:hypothetical protein